MTAPTVHDRPEQFRPVCFTWKEDVRAGRERRKTATQRITESITQRNMKLKELITKLEGKPDQDSEVEYLVINQDTGNVITCDLNGPATTDIMRLLAKHARQAKRATK